MKKIKMLLNNTKSTTSLSPNTSDFINGINLNLENITNSHNIDKQNESTSKVFKLDISSPSKLKLKRKQLISENVEDFG
jgi:hypothetical protein